MTEGKGVLLLSKYAVKHLVHLQVNVSGYVVRRMEQ